MHPSRISLRVLGAAALVAAVSSSAFAQGGRLSLAERVDRLEQDLAALASQVAQLRAALGD